MTWKCIIKWALRTPFLVLMAMLFVLALPVLGISWLFEHVIEPSWHWLWEDCK